MNYKKDKIICSSMNEYALYIIDTKFFIVESVFKSPKPVNYYGFRPKVFNEYIFNEETITLLNNDSESNKYFEFKWLSNYEKEKYSYIFKDDNIIIFDLKNNELYIIKKKFFLNIFE